MSIAASKKFSVHYALLLLGAGVDISPVRRSIVATHSFVPYVIAKKNDEHEKYLPYTAVTHTQTKIHKKTYDAKHIQTYTWCANDGIGYRYR